MNADTLNKWLTLAANVGILASIVFLATQIEQNNRMMQVEALTTNTANHIQIDLAGVPEDPASLFADYYRGRVDFNEDEALALASWLSANSWKFRNSFRLYELGVLSETDWQSEMLLISGYYGTPWGLKYFESAKAFWDPRYAEIVERALQDRQWMGTTYRDTLVE